MTETTSQNITPPAMDPVVSFEEVRTGVVAVIDGIPTHFTPNGARIFAKKLLAGVEDDRKGDRKIAPSLGALPSVEADSLARLLGEKSLTATLDKTGIQVKAKNGRQFSISRRPSVSHPYVVHATSLWAPYAEGEYVGNAKDLRGAFGLCAALDKTDARLDKVEEALFAKEAA